MSSKSRFFGALAVAFVAFAAYVVTLATGFGGPTAVETVSDLGILVAALWAAAACARAARRETGGSRRAWALMAGACLAWGAGEAMWSTFEIVLRREVPFPSPADVAYLGAIPLATAALLSFPTAPAAATSRARAILAGLIISGATLFVGWTLLLGPLFRETTGSLIERSVGLAYPLGDIAIISIVLVAWASARRGARASLALLALGLAGIAIADGGFTYLTLNGAYSSGNLIDAGWFAGYLLIALAATGRPRETDPAAGGARAERIRVVLPVVAVVVAAATAVAEHLGKGGLEPFLFWTAIGIVTLLLVHQLLTLLDNHALTRNLEAKIEGRTAELRAAVRGLEEAQRLQDAFVANVSHELRTPLTALVAAGGTLLRPELGLTGEARDLVERASRNAVRMSRLIEDLLVASGISSDIRLAPASFDAADRLRACLAGLRAHGKRLDSRIPATLPALGDPQRFDAIVDQLLSNADKFSPAGTTIHVALEGSETAVSLTIRDEGCGIPPAFRERVFDRFYQIDSGSTREHGGVGLGLHLAQQLARAMGGTLAVEDSARGASLRLTLPVPVDSPVLATSRG